MAESIKECEPRSFLDDFKKYFIDVHFDHTPPVEKKGNIRAEHYLNVYGLPSAFSTEIDTLKLNPIHRGTVLESKTVYEDWWSPFLIDGLAIDEMFELFNLHEYDNDYYNKEGACKDANSKTCDNYKKHKKYKMLSEARGNPVFSKRYDENIKISKIT